MDCLSSYKNVAEYTSRYSSVELKYHNFANNKENFIQHLTNMLPVAVKKTYEKSTLLGVEGEKSAISDLSFKNIYIHERKRIKCYVCRVLVNKSDLKYHLLFSEAKCMDCNYIATTCFAFKKGMGKSCKHLNYTYITDISKKITFDWFNIQENSLSREKDLVDHLRKYVFSLKLLKYRSPWNKGIRKCNQIVRSCELLHTRKSKSPVPGPLEYNTEIYLPKDGRYLIVTKPMEECPDCYTKIDISNFDINIHTCLIQNKCRHCYLPIYWVLTPPDGHEPILKIIV